MGKNGSGEGKSGAFVTLFLFLCSLCSFYYSYFLTIMLILPLTSLSYFQRIPYCSLCSLVLYYIYINIYINIVVQVYRVYRVYSIQYTYINIATHKKRGNYGISRTKIDNNVIIKHIRKKALKKEGTMFLKIRVQRTHDRPNPPYPAAVYACFVSLLRFFIKQLIYFNIIKVVKFAP